MAFRERVVVRSVGPAMRFGDAEIGEQQGSGFGLHRAAAVGMQGELAGGDIMLDDGVVEQGFEPVSYTHLDVYKRQLSLLGQPFRW